jgi:8-oxo-dGTP pyrophosphatase MutT (NUDIX family)
MANNFAEFRQHIEKALLDTLPGAKAQKLMAPGSRLPGEPDKNTKQAAVLITIFLKDHRLHTTFIKRSIYDGAHSGQIAFPGGQVEALDQTLQDTALRETTEEIGLQVLPQEVVGKLSKLYIPVSDFCVTPYVACLQNAPVNYVPDPEEVGEVLEIPLEELFAPQNLIKDKINVRGATIQAPAYQPFEYTIWGATAMILSELNALLAKLPQTAPYFVF